MRHRNLIARAITRFGMAAAAVGLLVLANTPAHADLIAVNPHISVQTGDIDLFEDVLEYVNVPVLGNAANYIVESGPS